MTLHALLPLVRPQVATYFTRQKNAGKTGLKAVFAAGSRP